MLTKTQIKYKSYTLIYSVRLTYIMCPNNQQVLLTHFSIKTNRNVFLLCTLSLCLSLVEYLMHNAYNAFRAYFLTILLRISCP